MLHQHVLLLLLFHSLAPGPQQGVQSVHCQLQLPTLQSKLLMLLWNCHRL
jgi:hypothetical protein